MIAKKFFVSLGKHDAVITISCPNEIDFKVFEKLLRSLKEVDVSMKWDAKE